MAWFLRALVALAVLTVPVQAWATAYHLTPTGSDGNGCSESSPCRTLNRADNLVKPGDTVVVHAGTYALSTFDAAGASSAPITWRGDGRPTLQGTDAAVYGAHVRITGMKVVGAKFALRAPYLEIDHNEFTASRQHACLLGGSGGHRGWWIHHNYLHDCGDFGNTATANNDHCVYLSDPVGARVENNLIDRCYSRGIQLYPAGSGAVVVNNTIHRAGRNGVLDNGNDGALIAGNVITQSGHTPGSSDHEYAVRVTSASGGVTVRNNLFWANRRNSVYGSATIAENVVADPKYAGPGDFHLLTGSPAIGLALAPQAPQTDLDDRPRDSDPDAGAYEHAGDQPPQEPPPPSCG